MNKGHLDNVSLREMIPSKDCKMIDDLQKLQTKCSKSETLLMLDKYLKMLEDDPISFLKHDGKHLCNLRTFCKALYDLSQNTRGSFRNKESLSELIVDGFDSNQIWEELQLDNIPFSTILGKRFEKLSKSIQSLLRKEISTKEKQLRIVTQFESDESEEIGIESNSDQDKENGDSDGDNDQNARTNSDESDRDAFEDEDELMGGKNTSDEEIDDEDEDSDIEDFRFDHVDDIKYADFFDPMDEEKSGGEENSKTDSRHQKIDSSEDVDEYVSDEETKVVSKDKIASHNEMLSADTKSTAMKATQARMSRHEKFLSGIKEYVGKLEDENLSAKPWTLIGEASATQRPVNSLLQESLDFEHGSRPAPTITEEYTETLEDKIKRRILEESWDDVYHKKIHVASTLNKEFSLDMEKSNKGLGEIYEEEYQLKSQGKSTGDVVSEALKMQHDAISAIFKTLTTKLDALSNYYFTPKPIKEELTVISNVPAIQMEDMIPVAVSNATLLAPQEIYSGKKGPLKGDNELTSQDKAKMRSKRKRNFKAEQTRKKYEQQMEGIKENKDSSKNAALKQLKTGKNVTISLAQRKPGIRKRENK